MIYHAMVSVLLIIGSRRQTLFKSSVDLSIDGGETRLIRTYTSVVMLIESD